MSTKFFSSISENGFLLVWVKIEKIYKQVRNAVQSFSEMGAKQLQKCSRNKLLFEVKKQCFSVNFKTVIHQSLGVNIPSAPVKRLYNILFHLK